MRLNVVDLGCFKIQTLLATLKSPNSDIRRSFVHFWKSNICTDQLDVQEVKRQCLTAAQNREIIPLDAGLRMDGLLAQKLQRFGPVDIEGVCLSKIPKPTQAWTQ